MITAQLTAADSGHPLLPASYDIIWSAVCLAILLVLFGKFVLPAFRRVTAERHELIEGGIARAKALQAEASRSKESYSAQLEDAARDAAAIRTGAHAERDQIVNAAREEATRTAADITARAQAQIAAEREQAVGSLQRDVSDLAVQLAGKIVGESLVDDRRAQSAIDRFIADLESGAVTVRSDRA